MLKKYFLFVLAFLSVTATLQSQTIPDRPTPPRLVNNFSSTGFISDEEGARLEQKLESFARQTSNQIVIVIVDDFGEMEPWQYATELGRKWGVGQEKEDNGIVILVKPTEKHYLQIVVGKGLEGAIPDIATKKIRENEMNPYFRDGRGYEGLDKGTDVLMALAKGEYDTATYTKEDNRFPFKVILIVFVIIIFIVLRSGRGGRGRGGMSMGTGFFLGSMFNSGRSFGGGGGFGGGSSGGFGGFGGGSFGGGGSGGSW
jgi:uncharacterized protein